MYGSDPQRHGGSINSQHGPNMNLLIEYIANIYGRETHRPASIMAEEWLRGREVASFVDGVMTVWANSLHYSSLERIRTNDFGLINAS